MPAMQILLISGIVALAAGAVLYTWGTTTLGNAIFFGGLWRYGTIGIRIRYLVKIGELPVKTTLVVLLVVIASTVGGVTILEEEMGKPLQVPQMRFHLISQA